MVEPLGDFAVMIAWARYRINRLCSTGGFESRDEVLSFATRISVWVVVVADVLNIIAHLLLNALGLLPYPVVPAAMVGVVISTVLAGTLTFGISYVIGLAIHDLSISRATFERLSRTDMLSGLLNRRAFLDAVAAVPGDASLVLFDIDRFKSINDRFGHDAGDRVIVSVAGALATMFEKHHVAARIGGEEFAVLITALSATERLALAQRTREMIAAQPVPLDSGTVTVTVSGGVAEQVDHSTFAALFAAADRALYVAKASGRNLIFHDHDIVDIMPGGSVAASGKLLMQRAE